MTRIGEKPRVLASAKSFPRALQRENPASGQGSPPVISPPWDTSYVDKERIQGQIEATKRCGASVKGLKTLPKNLEEMRDFLLEAHRTGDIVFINPGLSGFAEIVQLLQIYIDGAVDKRDTHVLIGYNHEIEAQIAFANKLLDNVSGITAVSSEMYGAEPLPAASKSAKALSKTGRYVYGLQPYIDKYLKTGTSEDLDVLREYINSFAGFNNNLCDPYYLESVEIARQNGYKFIAGDLSISERSNLRGLNNKQLEYAARESFAASNVSRYFDPNKKDVVFHIWGLEHIEQDGLPRHLECSDGQDKEIIPIALNGGKRDSANSFDLAADGLGWGDKFFVLFLDGYREAKIIVHLPVNGEIIYARPREKSGLIILR